MENGSFLYDLTLPLPQSNQNVKVKFASNADSLDQSQTVSQAGEKTDNTITIRGLDHFTIYFVTSGDDRSTDGILCDDPEITCTFGGLESLKQNDESYLDISSATGIPGWSDEYSDLQYVQFNFNHPELTGVSIANAKLKLVYKTNSIDGGYDSDAKLVISDDGNFDDPEEYEVFSVKPTVAATTDQPFLIQLPSQYQDSTKLTNLKIRFYLYGVADDGFVTTSFNQVVLLVNYSPPTSSLDTIDSPTNNNSLTVTGTATANGGAKVKNVEYRVDAGPWTPASASDGSFNSASELFTFIPDSLSEGNHLFETRATDSLDTIQTEIISLNLTVDKTIPAVSADNASTSWRTANITITLSASDSGGSNLNNARYNWNSVATASVGTTFTNGATINIPLEGDHILYLYADDNAGNSSTSSGSYKLDTSDPSVSVTGSSISWQSTLPAITVSTSDSISGVSGVKYAWDTDAASGTATSNGTNLASTYPGDGSHTLNLLATDNSGRTKTFSGTYKIDRGNPATPGTPTTTTPTNSTNQNWSWTAAADTISDIQNYLYRITGSVTQALTSTGSNVTSFTTTLREGIYNFFVTAKDNAGNTGPESSGGSLTIDITAPATPSATPAAGDYTSDQSVSLFSSDAGSGLASIYYTTDGSTPDNTKTLYSGAITVDKDMTIKAVAYDKAGNASDILEAVYGIAPKISAETSSSSTTTSATITWTTDDPTTSRVIYDTVSHSGLGEAPNYGYINSTVEDSTKVTSHIVSLTGLFSGTTYYYRTVSHGSPEAVSSEHSFITSSGGIGGSGVSDGKSATPSAPVCNNTKPGSAPTLFSALGGTNSVTLKWTEATGPLTYYLITYGTNPGAQTYGNPNIGGKGTTGYTVSGLSGGIIYYFQVRAGNGCAPGDFSNEISATTLGVAIATEISAEGFTPGVKGTSIDLTPTPTTSVLGETKNNQFSRWLIFLLIATGGFGAWAFFRRR